MAKVFLDRIEGARLQTALKQGNIVRLRMHTRVHIVTEIDVDPNSVDPNVLVKALESSGMPQLGDKHPSGDNSVLQFHDIRPMSNCQAKVITYYAPLDNGGTDFGGPEYTLEDGTIGQSITTQILPDGEFTPVRVSYRNPNDPKHSIPPKSVDFSYYQPMRTIVASALNLRGDSSWISILRNGVGTVNERKWLDKDTGFWLFYGLESTIALTTGEGRRYNVRATLICRNYLDWSFVSILQRDGQSVNVTPDEMSVIQEPYPVQTKPKDVHAKRANGAVRVYPYMTTDFSKIFNLSKFD